MARFTATYAITEATDWDSGDFFRFDKFRDQIGQVIEYFATLHDHTGDPGDGATLPAADPKQVWYYGPASPTWG